MKNLTRAILAAAVVVSSVPAMAQFQKPEDAAKYRQGHPAKPTQKFVVVQ